MTAPYFLPSIRAFSKADSVAGQGVGSAYLEQAALIDSELSDTFQINTRAKIGDFGDINHFHSINPEYRLAIPLAKRRGRTVGHVHFIPETVDDSIALPGPARWAFYKYMLNFYRATERLVTVNPWFIKALSERYNFDADTIIFIPNFVSEKQFFRIEDREQVNTRRRSWGAEDGQFVVMCAGQLQTRKGFFDVLNVARAMPDALFVWAGDFSFGRITSGYEQIRETKENLPANMRLIGLVPRDEMNECFNAGSLVNFIVARQVGMSLIHAMFSERTVEKYLGWTRKPGFTTAFTTAIVLPVAPDDLLCYLAGTTKMKFSTYTLIILLGKVPTLVAYGVGVSALVTRFLLW